MPKKKSSPSSMPWIIIIAGLVLCVAVIGWWWQKGRKNDSIIVEHVKQLSTIFTQIDQECGIIGFEHDLNYIDFLNVKSFAGSEVGSMNLAYPEKWQGPYLKDNPTVQEKQYQIMRTNKGYFIVPGTGVRLSNGTIIGKDILFNQETDIEKMVLDPKGLQFKGKPLAAKIELHREEELSLPLLSDE